MDGRRYFGCTAGLCAVADDSADIAERIGDSSSDLLVAAAGHIRDRRAGSARSTDRAAESRQRTDVMLNVDGHQVRDQKAAIHLCRGQMHALRIGYNRHSYCDALVAAARIDDDRQRTSAHTGVRTRGRAGAGVALDVITPVLQNRLADSCSPGIVQPLLGNRRVEAHLAFQNFFYFGQIHCVRVSYDSLQRHLRAVSLRGCVLILVLDRFLGDKDISAVLHDLRDICVVLFDRNGCLVVFGPHLSFDIEIRHIFCQRHVTDSLRHQFSCQLTGLVVHVRDDFQHLVRIASYGAEYRRGLNTLLSARIGNSHTLYVFDHVA